MKKKSRDEERKAKKKRHRLNHVREDCHFLYILNSLSVCPRSDCLASELVLWRCSCDGSHGWNLSLAINGEAQSGIYLAPSSKLLRGGRAFLPLQRPHTSRPCSINQSPPHFRLSVLFSFSPPWLPFFCVKLHPTLLSFSASLHFPLPVCHQTNQSSKAHQNFRLPVRLEPPHLLKSIQLRDINGTHGRTNSQSRKARALFLAIRMLLGRTT